MRKFVIALAAAGTAFAVATPAAAQYYPVPAPAYGYNGYGYKGYGPARALQARVDAVEYQIRRLDRRNVIRDDSADRLQSEAHRIEWRLRQASYGGLNPYEAGDISNRVARLEQRVQYAASRFGGYGYNGYNGYYDRDGDDRDARYENDRGWDHDD